ncbi:MAG: PAS domain S-box protein [Bacteroidales bacterium]
MLKNWLKNRIQQLNKKISIKHYFYFALTVYITGIVVYLIASYFIEKKDINKRINDKLVNAAQSLDYLLPMNYHDRAISRNSISDIEFNEILQLLTYHANNYNIKYIYTLVEQNGKLYITSSSATNHETRTGQNLSYYWQEYSEADKAFFDAFKTNLTTFVEYTNRWGTFRTLIIPKVSITGKKYLACADIDISYIDSLLWEKIIYVFFKALFFTLIILPLFHVLYKYHKKVAFKLKTELSKKELKVTHEEYLRNQSYQALRLLEEKFQALFYNSPLPMIILSQTGKVIDSNKACQDFLGISKFELNEHIIFTIPFFNSVNDFEKITEELMLNNKLEGYSIVLNTKNGNKPCKIWGTLLKSAQKPEYILIIQD